ncbi:MAG: hypothetical protein ACD_43C00046G0003 [uncultured bacterium]|nr:MAG: hypothetical protein ACD_43C00046G0003 [uncultured bacterium]
MPTQPSTSLKKDLNAILENQKNKTDDALKEFGQDLKKIEDQVGQQATNDIKAA